MVSEHIYFLIYRAIRNYSHVSSVLNWLVWFMVLNATFNNISVISWQSVLVLVEIGVPEIDKLDHIMLYQVHLPMNLGSNSQL
jgi:hypothetical protein